VTWTITDGSGNTVTCTQIVTVTDDQDPVITECPADVAVTADTGVCSTDASNVTLGAPVFNDNCSGAIASNDAPSTFPLGDTIVTWTVTDAAGNTTTCTQTVTVTDDEDPVITTCPADATANTSDDGTGNCTTTVALGTPVSNDNCSVATTEAQVNGTTIDPITFEFGLGDTTVTWLITDGSGNTTTCTQTVTVTDDENPTITCPANINVNIDAAACDVSTVNLGTPITDDNCSVASVTNDAPSTYPLGDTIVTWTVTDGSGNTATCTQTVTVIDNVDPTISCPADISVSADAGLCSASSVNLGTPTTSDCVVSTVTNDAPSTFPLGDTIVTWTVTDSSGNSASCTQTVTVTDDENPTITCPADVSVTADTDSCETLAESVTLGTPVTNDNCSVASVTNDAPSTFPLGDTTVTWTVTDGSGNTATCTQTVTVTDDQDPVITECPAPISITADADICATDATNVTLGTPVFTDNCSAGTTITNDAPASFPIGDTTVTWTITDGSGNTVTCTQIVTVTDDQDPVITECPADVAVTADTGVCSTDASNVTLGAPVFNDNCSGAIASNDAPSTFPLGDTIVTWTVTDTAGNTTTCTQTVTVTDDEDPTIICPDDITVNADAGLCSASNVDLGVPVTNDNCGVATVLNNALEPFALGQTIVTWTVTDNSGNTATCEQIVTVVDGELPELTCPPAVTVNVDAGTCEATNVDLGDLDVQDCTDVIITNNAPSSYPLGDTTVTWTVTDLAGNSETCDQIVTVIDNIPPTFVEALPTDTTVECDNVPTEETLTATDNCGDAVVTFEEVRIDGSCVSNYILERTWTATDEAGSTTVHTQTITVQDTTPPVFVERLPDDVTVECDAIPTPETITATDNCNTATVTTQDVIIDGPCVGTYTIERTYTATDECNLSIAYTQTINVVDTTAPTPVEAIEENITVSCTDIPEAPEVEFQDNCSTDIVVVFNEVNGFDDTVYEDYQIVRTWTVRDACNNEATYTQTLNVMLDEIITQVNGPDRCYDDGIIDLDEFLTSENKEGTWEMLEGDPVAELNGNLFNPTTLEPTVDFLPNNGDSIDYIFRYTGLDNGCINITEVTIRINPDCVVLPCGDSDIEISKALTPNGDGFNDTFDIMGIDLCGFTANVKIFNRWGALVYESDNYTLGEGQGSWQGNSHKSSVGSAGKVPNGTYYYIINLENSGLPPYTGPIYIGTK
jgi:gliding motility-associated-like protein